MSITVEATIGGTRVAVQRRDLEEEGQDPNFFDSDYSIAKVTQPCAQQPVHGSVV